MSPGTGLDDRPPTPQGRSLRATPGEIGLAAPNEPPERRAQASGPGGGGNFPRSRASRAARTGMPASHGTPTWHKPQP